MSYTICSRFKGEHIVYAGYTICTSREHIVYGAFCGSTLRALRHCFTAIILLSHALKNVRDIVIAILSLCIVYPFFSLEKKGILISNQSRSVIRQPACPCVRTKVRAVSCNCISSFTVGCCSFKFCSCIGHMM